MRGAGGGIATAAAVGGRLWTTGQRAERPESLEAVEEVGEELALLLVEAAGKEKGVVSPGTPKNKTGGTGMPPVIPVAATVAPPPPPPLAWVTLMPREAISAAVP